MNSPHPKNQAYFLELLNKKMFENKAKLERFEDNPLGIVMRPPTSKNNPDYFHAMDRK